MVNRTQVTEEEINNIDIESCVQRARRDRLKLYENLGIQSKEEDWKTLNIALQSSENQLEEDSSIATYLTVI